MQILSKTHSDVFPPFVFSKNADLASASGILETKENANVIQSTLRGACVFNGIGVHRGTPVTMTVHPADPFTGFTFIRSDVESKYGVIPAIFDTVTDTLMSTTVTNTAGFSVSTIEHIIAALVGAGITNARIEITGPEVPIMDGSSAVFAKAFQRQGIISQNVEQKTLIIKEAIRVSCNTGFVEFIPGNDRTFDVFYDFGGRFSGTSFEHGYSYNLDTDSFANLLSDARTFGLYEDGMKLQQMGLAKGASLENTVVLQNMRVMNQEGLRSADEFVRHKVLDAIGDIGLAGCAIKGSYRAHNPSHDLNNKLLRALFSNQSAIEWK